jgi:hypothetical protein
MNAAALIDPTALSNFVELIHERCAASLHGINDINAQRGVLHLCTINPDSERIFTSAYHVGDITRMVKDAITDAEAGLNVYTEARLVRPGLPGERGKLNATLAVFALVCDDDVDTDMPCTANVPASAIVTTSPGNSHRWYFVQPAIIGADEAKELGKLLRKNGGGGDHCSFNPTQPFRLPGLINIPGKRKVARGRTVVPTQIKLISNKTYTAAQLRTAFAVNPAPTTPAPRPTPRTDTAIHRPAYHRSRARALLAAEPGSDDRSAQFMAAANHAAMGGLTADDFETMARQYVNGAAGKYLQGNRLRREVDRCYAKIIVNDNENENENENE